MALRAIRGAIQLDSDEREHLLKLTAELLAKMMHANNMHTDQLVSILFTATPDITSEFPALAARELGLGDVDIRTQPTVVVAFRRATVRALSCGARRCVAVGRS